jgi:hypothetical protein
VGGQVKGTTHEGQVALQHISTVQCSTVQCSTVQYSIVQYSIVQDCIMSTLASQGTPKNVAVNIRMPWRRLLYMLAAIISSSQTTHTPSVYPCWPVPTAVPEQPLTCCLRSLVMSSSSYLCASCCSAPHAAARVLGALQHTTQTEPNRTATNPLAPNPTCRLLLHMLAALTSS